MVTNTLLIVNDKTQTVATISFNSPTKLGRVETWRRISAQLGYSSDWTIIEYRTREGE